MKVFKVKTKKKLFYELTSNLIGISIILSPSKHECSRHKSQNFLKQPTIQKKTFSLVSPARELVVGAPDVQRRPLHPHADLLVVVEAARLELEVRVVPVDDGPADAVVPDAARVVTVLGPARTARGGGGPVGGSDSVGVWKKVIFFCKTVLLFFKQDKKMFGFELQV